MKKITWLFGLVLGLATVLPVSAQDSVPMAIGEWAPFTSESMTGNGAIAEVVSATFKAMGSKGTYSFHSWEDCFDMVKSGKAFGSFPYVKTREREKDVLFSDPIFISQTVFFHYDKKRSKISYQRLSDLKKYKIGGIKGYFYESIFKNAGLSATYVDSETELLKLLHAGKIDLIPENDLVGWNIIRKQFPGDKGKFGTLKKRLKVVPNYLIVSRRYPGAEELLDKFNNAMKKIRENGVYYQIMEKYYP